MDRIAVIGGRELNGVVHTSGAKNSSLPILISTLLASGTHVLHNVPHLKDIDSTLALLENLGCSYKWETSSLIIEVRQPRTLEANYDVVRKMRASILCLGPLLSRYGEAIVSLPGGCAIGSRPIDLHLDGMKALGAHIEVKEGYVIAKANTQTSIVQTSIVQTNIKKNKLVGATYLFETSTVGGTENMMMAACLADGKTILENAAKEPEIVDLAEYLNKMGAKITGQGSSIITIEGVDELKPAEHTVIADRIEAGTLLLAGAITGGEVTVDKCDPTHLEALILKMREAGIQVDTARNSITVRKTKSIQSVDITTAPHPLFPTDLQAQFMALMCMAQGTSVITESVFENRFMHVQELVRLNADITPKSRVAVVRGAPNSLNGAQVMATDLRASASLVLAGLVASGETTVNRIYHLDRGYEHLELKLATLGAQIRRF